MDAMCGVMEVRSCNFPGHKLVFLHLALMTGSAYTSSGAFINRAAIGRRG